MSCFTTITAHEYMYLEMSDHKYGFVVVYSLAISFGNKTMCYFLRQHAAMLGVHHHQSWLINSIVYTTQKYPTTSEYDLISYATTSIPEADICSN